MSRVLLSFREGKESLPGADPIGSALRGVSLLTSSVARIACVAASLLMAVAAVPSAQAEIVLGNLGSSGTNAPRPIGPAGTNPAGTSAAVNRALAMGFVNKNDPYMALSSVTLGLSNTTASPATVSRSIVVYNDAGGVPGTVFATSNPVVTSGTAAALYTFTFPEDVGVMKANRKYWVVPSEFTRVNWFRTEGLQDPVPFNDSGYTYAGALRKNSTNQWVTANQPNYSFSLAVIPVPESSTLTLAGIGLVIGGWTVRRRQRRVITSATLDSVGEEASGDIN